MTPPKHSTPATVDSANGPSPGLGGPAASDRILERWSDGFAYSSGLAASVGGALTLVASRVFDAPDETRWVSLVATGTFIIYNLDRLRDLERDRGTSPHRTAFVSRNQNWLYASVVVAASVFTALLWTTPPRTILLCLAVGLVGLFHRRLKKRPALKTFYVSVSWVGACVGLPWLASQQDRVGPWVVGVLLASLAANLIASNLRDDEVLEVMRVNDDRRRVLWAARSLILSAIAIALLGPGESLALVWIPICEGVALIRFRPTERYGHLAVDGGLLIGAIAAAIHLAVYG